MEYPKGTTKEQWERYYDDLKAHENRCDKEKPKNTDYGYDSMFGFRAEADRTAYNKAHANWEMMCSCDAPNKPGYYRANND